MKAIGAAAKGKRVLDIGTGPEALLAIAAARAGASCVTACEVNPKQAELARAAVKEAKLEGVVSVITGHSSQLALPEVDLVIHEIVGDIASEEGMAATLKSLAGAITDAAVRETSAWSLPRRVETWVAPANLRLPQQSDGSDTVEVRLPMLPPAPCLLGKRQLLEVIDAGDLQLLQETAQEWSVASASTLTGFFLAPRIVLDAETTIDCWSERTSWRSVLVLLPEPVLVEVGDLIRLAVVADLRRFPVVHTLSTSIVEKATGATKALGCVKLCEEAVWCGYRDNTNKTTGAA